MKLLYNKTTQLLQPYPRSDDEDVAGLDASTYDVFSVVQNAAPEGVAGFQLRPTQVIDVAAKTVTRGYELVAIEQPPITVSMTALKLALEDAGLYQTVASAVSSGTTKVQILWYNTLASMSDPTLLEVADSLGISVEQIRILFEAAAAKNISLT